MAVTKSDLSAVYHRYIACLNEQDWTNLEQFVHDDVIHNDRRFGLQGYRHMLERDFDEIPDLYFDVQKLIVDAPHIASRIVFDCTPIGNFFGLAVDGMRIRFAEHVIYEFHDEKIRRVWSVVDKAAIEAQLQSRMDPCAPK